MNDLGMFLRQVWPLWGLALLICFGVWGVQPLVREWRKGQIRRQERVRFVTEVNVEMSSFRVQQNLWFWPTWTLLLLVVIAIVPLPGIALFAGFVYMMLIGRQLWRNSSFQKVQSVLLTERGIWVLPERLGKPVWAGEWSQFAPWPDITGYRIDGSYVQFYEGERMRLQAEYAPYDYEVIKEALEVLKVPRLDPSDRIWVSQLNEEMFYKLEDDTCNLAWDLIEMFTEDFQTLKVRPEFGVMRNMPGDRLLDEHARSWLQLHLVDIESGERRASSMFPLWQSNGAVGFVLGVRGQELVDRLQKWLHHAVEMAAGSPEEEVLS